MCIKGVLACDLCGDSMVEVMTRGMHTASLVGMRLLNVDSMPPSSDAEMRFLRAVQVEVQG